MRQPGPSWFAHNVLNLDDTEFVLLLTKIIASVIAACFTLEITPIKINPISWFCKRIANNVNKDRDAKIDDISKKLDEHISLNKKYEALTARTNIMRFAEELKIKHIPTEEHFDIIIEDIDFYEKYCTDHPEFPNNKCNMAIKMIKDFYARHILHHD